MFRPGADNPKYKNGGVKRYPHEYNSWRAAKSRCYQKTYWCYHRYGGRGIKVCDRWLGDDGFYRFLEDMGPKPTPKHTLDRIDNDGDYCPENCRWSTQKEQVANSIKKSRARITREEIEASPVGMYCIYDRLKRGWSKEDALHTPSQQWKPAKVHGPCQICGKTWKRKDTKYCSKECYLKSIADRGRNALGHYTKKGGDDYGRQD